MDNSGMLACGAAAGASWSLAIPHHTTSGWSSNVLNRLINKSPLIKFYIYIYIHTYDCDLRII